MYPKMLKFTKISDGEADIWATEAYYGGQNPFNFGFVTRLMGDAHLGPQEIFIFILSPTKA